MRPTLMQKHLSALEPRVEKVTRSARRAVESASSDEGATVAIAVEQLHSRALAALIGVIEDKWRFCDDDEESKSDVPRATECSQLTDEDDDYDADDHVEDDLLFVDFDDMSIHSILEVTSTTTGKPKPSSEPKSLKEGSPRVAAIKSFSLFCGEFPIMMD